MKQTFIAISDLHGNTDQYEAVFSLVQKLKPTALLLCGDLFPKDGGKWSPENKIRTIRMQKAYIQNDFLPFLEKTSMHTRIYAIYGNDDFQSHYSYTIDNLPSNVFFIENKALKIPNSNISVAGYPYVPLTPFLLKDWERWDTTLEGMTKRVYTEKGFITKKDGSILPINMNDVSKTISCDLHDLSQKSNPTHTIYLMHGPPYGTNLDMVSPLNPFIVENNVHVGSKAIYDFILQNSPLLTLHGHIHETYEESGFYTQKIGTTTSASVAHDFTKKTLTYLKISIEDTILLSLERLSIKT